MSSNLTIPENRIEGFAILARLKENSVQELVNRLSKLQLSLMRPESIINEVISKKLKLTKENEAVLVISTILTLFPALIESGKPIQVFLTDLLEAADEAIINQELLISEQERHNLAANLFAFLTVLPLGLSAKASSVLYENERSLSSSRVMCEVRPVFDIEEDLIGGAVVIHNLRLEYFTKNSEETGELYIHLDDRDIDDLIFKLERAKSKSIKIKEMLLAAGTPLIDGDCR
jgi:hypothetical protein